MQRVNFHDLFPPHTYDEWREVVQAQLKGAPFEKKLVKPTYEGIDVLPMYFEKDIKALSFCLGYPGDPPFARGAMPLGAGLDGCEICQEIAETDPARFNRAAKGELEKGQTYLHMTLDENSLNTRLPHTGQAASSGLSLAVVSDAKQALSGISLENTPIRLQTGASPLPAAALLLAALADAGVSLAGLKGQVTADPAGHLAFSGTLPGKKETMLDQLALFTAWAGENAPELKTIGVSGTPYHEAGASAVQELAFALAAGAAYLREMGQRGIDPEKAAAKTAFQLSIGSDFFMEIAKFRAARILWDQVAGAFGASEKARTLYIHARTSQFNKTVTDPYVNMLRVTTEVFSAIAGGCDAICTGPFDEVFRKPSEFSRRVARNVSIILREECHFNKVLDPAGGSYYVETITDQLAKKAWDLFKEVEKAGGIFKALESGFCADRIAEVASKRAANYAKRKDVLVGTNKYPNIAEPLDVLAADATADTASRTKALEEFMANRDGDAVQSALSQLAQAAPENKCAASVAAAGAGATLEELAKTLGLDGGVKIKALNIHRAGERFEAMRLAASVFAKKTGAAPKLFSANLGPLAVHKPRADFSQGFFSVAGFEIISSPGFSDAREAAKAVLDSGAKVTVICSSDALYPEMVPELAETIKASDPEMTVILAGYPKDHVEAFKAAGVDEFIYLGSNAASLLENLQKKLGVAQ